MGRSIAAGETEHSSRMNRLHLLLSPPLLNALEPIPAQPPTTYDLLTPQDHRTAQHRPSRRVSPLPPLLPPSAPPLAVHTTLPPTTSNAPCSPHEANRVETGRIGRNARQAHHRTPQSPHPLESQCNPSPPPPSSKKPSSLEHVSRPHPQFTGETLSPARSQL